MSDLDKSFDEIDMPVPASSGRNIDIPQMNVQKFKYDYDAGVRYTRSKDDQIVVKSGSALLSMVTANHPTEHTYYT